MSNYLPRGSLLDNNFKKLHQDRDMRFLISELVTLLLCRAFSFSLTLLCYKRDFLKNVNK
jgi:hypothetical protein